MNKKSSIIIGILIIVLLTFFYYRQDIVTSIDPDASQEVATRQVRATVTYPVPGTEDTEEYIVSVDKDGVIVDLKGRNVNEPESESQIHLNEFMKELLVEVKGKKLSEIEAIDKVGSSTLTTEAFNSALDELKSQL